MSTQSVYSLAPQRKRGSEDPEFYCGEQHRLLDALKRKGRRVSFIHENYREKQLNREIKQFLAVGKSLKSMKGALRKIDFLCFTRIQSNSFLGKEQGPRA